MTAVFDSFCSLYSHKKQLDLDNLEQIYYNVTEYDKKNNWKKKSQKVSWNSSSF